MHAGHAPILLNDACVLNAWDDIIGATNEVGVDGAPGSIIVELVTDRFPEVSVPVSKDEITLTVDPLFC